MSVSVIMPAKNAASFIHEAIASVIAQGADVGELIVVDDGSIDRSNAIVRAFSDSRIRLIPNDGGGVSAARNTGARAASGEWLMFLDADDRLRNGAVPALLRAAALETRAIVIYGEYARIDKDGRPIGLRRLLGGRKKPSGQVLTRIAAGNFIVNGGVMIARAEFLRRGRRLRRGDALLRGLALLVPSGGPRRIPVHSRVASRLSRSRQQHDERHDAFAAGFLAGRRSRISRPRHRRQASASLDPLVAQGGGGASDRLRRDTSDPIWRISQNPRLRRDGRTPFAFGYARRRA